MYILGSSCPTLQLIGLVNQSKYNDYLLSPANDRSIENSSLFLESHIN